MLKLIYACGFARWDLALFFTGVARRTETKPRDPSCRAAGQMQGSTYNPAKGICYTPVSWKRTDIILPLRGLAALVFAAKRDYTEFAETGILLRWPAANTLFSEAT